jgi:hypothetical protein
MGSLRGEIEMGGKSRRRLRLGAFQVRAISRKSIVSRGCASARGRRREIGDPREFQSTEIATNGPIQRKIPLMISENSMARAPRSTSHRPNLRLS